MEWTEVESGMMPDIPSLFCGSFVSGIIKGALSPILGLLQKAKRHIAPPPPPHKKNVSNYSTTFLKLKLRMFGSRRVG